MIKKWPQEQVYWYTLRQPVPHRLSHSIKTPVLIIGGGMAGLMAAYRFASRKIPVVLVEKEFCGAGASGKSSGFITPDSELGLASLLAKYGPTRAHMLWEFVRSGVEHIRSLIKHYNIPCDYQEHDSLFVANSYKAMCDVQEEHVARQKLHYSSTVYSCQQIPTIVGARNIYGSIRYPETFSIVSYLYCQALKNILCEYGVRIYENTPVIKLSPGYAHTPYGDISAEQSIVCVDYALSSVNIHTTNIYHVQTFLAVSQPLPDHHVRLLFPEGPLLVWDSDIIYNYYRLTKDNRLLIGGGNLLYTYGTYERPHAPMVLRKLSRYVQHKFPYLDVRFEYFWPGLLGVSKDLLPIADYDHATRSIYYIAAATGLPWAAALGVYSADKLIDGRHELDAYFTADRSFPLGTYFERIFGVRATFALAHFISTR